MSFRHRGFLSLISYYHCITILICDPLNKEEFILLITRYREGNASELEEQQLINYFSSFQQPWDEETFGSKAAAVSRIKDQLLTKIPKDGLLKPAHKVYFIRRFRWVAAAILLLIAGATWLLLSTKDYESHFLSQNERFKNDIAPARTGALLTLSDGTVINLDTAGNGELGNGFYKTTDAIRIDQANVDYATLETPFGHTMRAVLSDGTIVWLNAGSSIRFPTSFSGNKRQVRITGEAYFEVAKQSIPFIVETGKENVEVLGTHFNVNTYEALHLTTLLEGSVKVGRTILQPGEQWDGKLVKQPDLNEVMAWKEGLFRFKDATIEVLMKDIARWYAVEVVFEGAKIKQQFIATIPRTATIVEVLRALETTGGVHFSIVGKKVTVLP